MADRRGARGLLVIEFLAVEPGGAHGAGARPSRCRSRRRVSDRSCPARPCRAERRPSRRRPSSSPIPRAMDVVRAQLTATATAGAVRAPVNQFAHMPAFPVRPRRRVVTPNVDTLTSSAWVDLTAEPLVLSLPDTAGRYYAMPLYDAWTTVVATLGARTTEPGRDVRAGRHRAAQPASPGTCPSSSAPTAHAWSLGHIRSDGPRDHAGVRELQEQIRLTPLSRWPGPGAEDPVPASPDPLDAASPVAQVARMDPREYFTRVARLLAVDPAHGTDRGRLQRLEALGVAAGRPPAWSLDDRPLVREIARGMDEGLAQVEAAARRLSSGDRAWTSPADLLRRQSEPLQRAALAWTGLGAWPRADGLFYTTQVDASGAALTGQRPHVLRFAPGSEPPARAFWSPDRVRRRRARRRAPLQAGRRRPRPAAARARRVIDDPPVGGPAAFGRRELAPDAARAVRARPAPVLAGADGPRRELVAARGGPGRGSLRPGGRPARRGRLTRARSCGAGATPPPSPTCPPTRTAAPRRWSWRRSGRGSTTGGPPQPGAGRRPGHSLQDGPRPRSRRGAPATSGSARCVWPARTSSTRASPSAVSSRPRPTSGAAPVGDTGWCRASTRTTGVRRPDRPPAEAAAHAVHAGHAPALPPPARHRLEPEHAHPRRPPRGRAPAQAVAVLAIGSGDARGESSGTSWLPSTTRRGAGRRRGTDGRPRTRPRARCVRSPVTTVTPARVAATSSSSASVAALS